MSQAAKEIERDLMLYDEAAQQLGITVSALKQAISAGKIQSVKIPGERRKLISRQEIENYKAKRYRSSTWAPQSAVSIPTPAPAPEVPAMPTREELAAIEAKAAAASAPLLEGWREASKGLTAIGMAALFGMRGPEGMAGLEALLDPKRLAG